MRWWPGWRRATCWGQARRYDEISYFYCDMGAFTFSMLPRRAGHRWACGTETPGDSYIALRQGRRERHETAKPL